MTRGADHFQGHNFEISFIPTICFQRQHLCGQEAFSRFPPYFCAALTINHQGGKENHEQ